jgi:hypothetical protein
MGVVVYEIPRFVRNDALLLKKKVGQCAAAAPEAAQSIIDKGVKDAAATNDFTAAGKAKIASLGKSEKGKRLVVRSDARWGCSISVYTWENGEYRYYGYTFLYSSRKSDFDDESKGERVTEKSADGLWYLKAGETNAKTWQERYDEFTTEPYSKDYKVVE